MTTTLNKEEYIKLLSETVPRIIDTEIEHKRLLNEVDKFMDLGENLTDEQAEVLQLLITLIEQYENKVYQMKEFSMKTITNNLLYKIKLKTLSKKAKSTIIKLKSTYFLRKVLLLIFNEEYYQF